MRRPPLFKELLILVLSAVVILLSLQVISYSKRLNKLTSSAKATKSASIRTVEASTTKVSSQSKIEHWIYLHSKRISKREIHELTNYILKNTRYPLLTISIITAESNFNSKDLGRLVVTKHNERLRAIGLMQILPSKKHLAELRTKGIIEDKRDLFDSITNIKAGNIILRDIMDINNNDLQKALSMYVGANNLNYKYKVLTYLGELHLLAIKKRD